MPAQSQWLLRVPEILATLCALETPWIDRAVVEQVFHVRRRRAIELMHAFEGFQVGRTFLVDRRNVIDQLRAVQNGESFQWERKRRQRVSETLTSARQYSQATSVSIAVSPSPDWPAGVRLQPGQMLIDFTGVPDLLEKLYSLAQAAASDFEGFQAAVQGSLRESKTTK